MSKSTPFAITISGEQKSRQSLIGVIVDSGADLSVSFHRKSNDLVLLFRYRGDARLVLKKAGRHLKCDTVMPDMLVYQGASALINKLPAGK